MVLLRAKLDHSLFHKYEMWLPLIDKDGYLRYFILNTQSTTVIKKAQ